MNAQLKEKKTNYRFGPYVFHGPHLSTPTIKAVQKIATAVRAGILGHDVLRAVANDLGHEVSGR
jgi:hypothetical protein